MRRNKAFTILELVTVMAIFMALSLVALPILIRQIQSTNAEFYTYQISSNIFYYQQNAFANKDNTSYGFKFEGDSYTLFTGPNSSSGTVISEIELPNNIKISEVEFENGFDEIVFSSNKLYPNTNGTFSVSDGEESFVLEINSEGYIGYTRHEN
jgi:type II secretory pathway pseudopilin PulG